MKPQHRRVICHVLVHLTLMVAAFSYMVLGGYILSLIEGTTDHIKKPSTPSVTTTKSSDLLDVATQAPQSDPLSDAPTQTTTSNTLADNPTQATQTDLLDDPTQPTKSNDLLDDPNLATKSYASLNDPIQKLHKLNQTAAKRRLIRASESLDNSDPSEIKWTLLNGFLYGYSTVTTIGYGHLKTATNMGRIFYVFFGILGIIIFALAINDLGYYIEDFFIWVFHKIFRKYNQHSFVVPLKTLVLLPAILFVFLLYLVLGGLLLPLWEKEWDFVKGFYVSFDAISTVGIGDIYPKNKAMFWATLAYFTFGMAVGCAGIGFLRDFGRILHFLGAKPKNCAEETVWFAGKHMKVGDLVEVVGCELGATRSEIKSVKGSLDRLVRETFRQNKTRSVRNKDDKRFS